MTQTLHGEPSFHLATPELELHLTQRGGHMAPVTFHLPEGDVAPYSLSPWLPAEHPDQPTLLAVLRGDFFCFPFGGQVAGPPHGDPANAKWTEVSQSDRSICVVMDAKDSGARLQKTITTLPGHHALYLEHQISNAEGAFNYGTHPILDFSGLAEGAGRVTVSPFHWASVYPGAFSNPEAGETQCLEHGVAFQDLRRVPLAAGGTTDLTHYPARLGNDDLVMVAHLPATDAQPFAWTAAVFDDYVWISLKKPADFPSTILWLSNGGRSAAPWHGQHLGRMGIEDVCSHFCDGVDTSRLDLLKASGIPTTRQFQKDLSVSLRTIQAVVPVPRGFDAVASIAPDGAGIIKLTADSGCEIIAKVDWNYLS
jgi:hypothetical protein